MKVLQFGCREGRGVDLRQANAVLKHRPDIILWESPAHLGRPGSRFNRYRPEKKPLKELKNIEKNLRSIAKVTPWVLSDVYTYRNIFSLWKTGHQILLFDVDAPSDLLREGFNPETHKARPERRGAHLLWWVRIYIREVVMARSIEAILKKVENKNQTVLVFIEKFHWINVQFLLTHPTQKEIWRYYFGGFRGLTRRSLEEQIKRENKVFWKYWKKVVGIGNSRFGI